MECSEWKSPRRIEADIKAYRSHRFEDYMSQVDEGSLEQVIAIAALREELENLSGEKITIQSN